MTSLLKFVRDQPRVASLDSRNGSGEIDSSLGAVAKIASYRTLLVSTARL